MNLLNLLFEGRQEKEWIKKNPEYQTAFDRGIKTLSDLAWIKKAKGTEPLEDVIGDVLTFKSKSIQQKLKSNNVPFQLNKRHYPDINSLRILLGKLQDVSDEESKSLKDTFKDSGEVERIRKVGNWDILMPISKKGSVSCDITGKDTTWCTTKRKGQNLFYSYAGREDINIILFYVMDYSRTPDLKMKTNIDSRLSIGYVNGKIKLDGKRGGLSVDALNNGLTKSKLQKILGENYNIIINTLEEKIKKLDGGNPAKEKINKMVNNVFLLKKTVKDYGNYEKVDFFKQIVSKTNASEEVLNYIYGYLVSREGQESDLAWQEKDTMEQLMKNPNLPQNIIKDILFAEDFKFRYVESILSNSEKLTEKHMDSILNKRIEEFNKDNQTANKLFHVFSAIAQNKKTPEDLLYKMTDFANNLYKKSRWHSVVRAFFIVLINNPNITVDIAKKILENIKNVKNKKNMLLVRDITFGNYLPEEVIRFIMDAPHLNYSGYYHTLASLIKKRKDISINLIKYIYEKYNKDLENRKKVFMVIQHIIKREDISFEFLKKIFDDQWIRFYKENNKDGQAWDLGKLKNVILKHPKAPSNILDYVVKAMAGSIGIPEEHVRKVLLDDLKESKSLKNILGL